MASYVKPYEVLRTMCTAKKMNSLHCILSFKLADKKLFTVVRLGSFYMSYLCLREFLQYHFHVLTHPINQLIGPMYQNHKKYRSTNIYV